MSRDPIREYLEWERTQRHRRIRYAVAAWIIVVLSALLVVVVGGMALSWAIVTFS